MDSIPSYLVYKLISWTNVNLSSIWSCRINLRTMPVVMFKLNLTKFRLKLNIQNSANSSSEHWIYISESCLACSQVYAPFVIDMKLTICALCFQTKPVIKH